ncbi:Sec7 domain-containing protein [Clostridium sp.]|uniref:Sec7 domain-containing protein n=1 Tax=Clostridium sp. TaxID=1506 RepID=UPI003F3B506E
MRQNYDTFDYWEGLISENKTIRGHMFMDEQPSEKSLYIHTLVFCKNNGLDNIWGYFPNEKALLGYIQYSFLQEAFYKWIYGKNRLVVNIPNVPVERIISDGEKNKAISKDTADKMRESIETLKKCWKLPNEKVIPELMRFARKFNRTWYGDQTEFLYIKVFNTAEELGDFVVNSSYMTTTAENFKTKTKMTIEDWKNMCRKVGLDRNVSDEFREILIKNLTEVI